MARDFRYFAIFGAMRTGSNLLERSLNQFSNLHCHGELFNPAFIGKEGRSELHGISLHDRELDPSRLIDAITEADDTTIPGFRIFQDHDTRVTQLALKDPDCGRIILSRDPLDSYVSLKIARQTDQWMLGNIKKRKAAQIVFDPAEYDVYRQELSGYYAHLRRVMQVSGTTAFDLAYQDIKDLNVLNGLGRFLGATDDLQSLEEPIKRQNPEPLHQKVVNYEEMLDHLDLPFVPINDSADSDVPIGKLIEHAIGTDRLFYMPMPGVGDVKLRNSIAEISNQQGFNNQNKLSNWLDDNIAALPFTVIQHPVERAYHVFCTRIARDGRKGYPRVRQRLKNHHGLALDYDLHTPPKDSWAEDFEAFCTFLKANLAGQTGIRIDLEWTLQSQILHTVGGYVPIRRILKVNELPSFCAENGISAESTEPAVPQAPVALADAYSKRIENLLRAAYAKDYRKFGFGPWSGSL